MCGEKTLSAHDLKVNVLETDCFAFVLPRWMFIKVEVLWPESQQPRHE